MRRLSDLRESAELWQRLNQRANALLELIELAMKEGNVSLQDSFQEEIDALEAQLHQLELGGRDHG